jgi:hypothetical protein
LFEITHTFTLCLGRDSKPTYCVSCVARIYSVIPPIDNAKKLIESQRKAKTVVKLTSNLIKKKLRVECFYILISGGV